MRLAVFVCIALLSACIARNNVGNRSFEIDTEQAQEDDSELFEAPHIIPLETLEDAVMVRADKILVRNDNIYLLDESQNILFVFDTIGRFVKKLDKVGRGPGEYIMINDFCIDEDSENIEILDSFSGKCKIYDADFNFIEEFRIPSGTANYFMRLNDSITALFSESDGMAYLYNRAAKETYSELVVSNETIEFKTGYGAANSPFKSYSGETLFLAPAQKRVYKVTPEGFELKYSFSFGKNEGNLFSLPVGGDLPYYMSLTRERDASGKVDALTNFMETQDVILLLYNGYRLVYLKKDEKRFHIVRPIPITAACGNVLYSANPKEYFQLMLSKEFLKLDNSQVQVINELPDISNPIIISYKLK